MVYQNLESDDLELSKVGHRNKGNTFEYAIIWFSNTTW